MGYIDTRLLPQKGVLLLPGIFAPERIQSLRDSVVVVVEAEASFSYSPAGHRAPGIPRPARRHRRLRITRALCRGDGRSGRMRLVNES